MSVIVPPSSPDSGPGPRPALVALALLAAGFAAARWSPPPLGHSSVWFGVAAAALVGAALTRGWPCRAALSVAVLVGSVGWFTLRINERPRDSLAFLIDPDPLAEPAPARIGGMVMATPREIGGEVDRWPLPPRPRQTAFDLRVGRIGDEAESASVSGVLRVRIDAPLAHMPPWLRAGAFIELTGVLRPIGPPLNPGEPPRDLLAAQDSLVGSLIVPSTDLVHPSQPATGAERVRSRAAALVAGLHDAVDRTVGGTPQRQSSKGRALLRAMLLGERDPALREVESAFRRVGLVHIIAISGFNIAVLAWVVLLAVRLTGDRGRLEPAIAAAAVSLYMLILPGEASIQRAGWTALVFTVSEALGRRYDRMTLLAWTALALLLVRPMDLWSLGFQLSFGIVAALLGLGSRVHERLWGMSIRGLVHTPRQRTWWWIGGSLVARALKLQISSTLLAWAVAAPLIALHTGLFSPLAPIASMVVLPVSVVMMVAGYAAILLGLIAPPLSAWMNGGLEHLSDAAVWLVTRIDEWPGATVYLPRLSAAWAVLATACIIYWLGWAWGRDWRAWVLTIVAGAWLAVLCVLGTRLPPGTALRVDALVMGDGGCTLVRAGDAAMLIDCGASGSRPDADDAARAVRELGGWRVPTVLLTEPRVESWSLLPGVLGPLGVRTVLIPQSLADAAAIDPGRAAARLLDLLREQSIVVRVLEPGDQFALGAAVVTMTGEPGGIGEDRSLVPRVRIETPAGPRSAIFAASTRYSRLDALIGREHHADVLIVPRATRASDRPAESVRALGASVVIHTAGPASARDLLARFGPTDTAPRLTAQGAVWAQFGGDGAVTAGPHSMP